MKLLEWNINKRSKKLPTELLVCQKLKDIQADIICLLEY